MASSAGRERARHEICRLRELPPGERRIVTIGKRSIGIFHLDGGGLHAIKNTCPHQGAELCKGPVGGAMLPAAPGEYRYALEGRVLRCPWHFWEFDIPTGEVVFVPNPKRVKTYQVELEAVAATGKAQGRANADASPKLEKVEVAVEDSMVVLYV